jgi:hypothetical protein
MTKVRLLLVAGVAGMEVDRVVASNQVENGF